MICISILQPSASLVFSCEIFWHDNGLEEIIVLMLRGGSVGVHYCSHNVSEQGVRP